MALRLVIALAMIVIATGAWSAEPIRIAVLCSLTGFSATAGIGVAEAARLAADEAISAGGRPVALEVLDDRSSEDASRENAAQVAAGEAVAVIGPGTTPAAMAAGPILEKAGLAAITPHAHGDAVTASATVFRPTFSMSDMGGHVATYLRHALNLTRAVVVFKDNGYGRPFAAGFKAAAEPLGIEATYQAFLTTQAVTDIVRRAAADPAHPAIVLAMVEPDAVAALIALARQGLHPTVIGTSAIANDEIVGYFSGEPEWRRDPGMFTDGVYAAAPVIPDSANAETIAFVERYQARYGHPPRWEAIQGYDSARLAIAAARAAAEAGGSVAEQRRAVRDWLARLDGPSHAVGSLTGPLWFTPARGRIQPIRVGRFSGMRFESAPLQLVPVPTPTAAEIAQGALVRAGDGTYARVQRVVYTGVYLNEISRIDIARSTFSADFYLWLRFAQREGAADPTDIDFPDLPRGSFDPARPAASGDLDDGTAYRLWRIRGDFKNDFDLHHYPLDRQTLAARLFNAAADTERLVYVQDRRTLDGGVPGLVPPPAMAASPGLSATTVSPTAFRNLTQWVAERAEQRRDNLVTDSGLGDPRLIGVAQARELSGYRLEVAVARRTVATLAKTLLPLGIMALIMLASLYFPHGLVKEKITVAITAALSGAVLLSSVNAQLGTVGYTMAVEYVFYVFFGLCLLCIVAVLFAERLRVAGRGALAARTEVITRWLYLAAMAATIGAACVAAASW